MTFLASLTTGAAMLLVGAATEWQSEVGREVTIQVRPLPARDIEADVRNAVGIARAAPGIARRARLTARKNPRGSSNLGSAQALRSTNCRSRA